MKMRSLALTLGLLLAACAQSPRPGGVAPAAKLRIASWNLEFLAEKDGAGCSPRTAADYDRMRRIADSLKADVIAFQEAETPAAAARVFDPARYTILMEERPGQPTGNCKRDDPTSPAFIRQRVGIAIRKDIPFTRAPDVTDLELGDPNLRSGVDVTLQPANGAPLRLLAIHLKSGCFYTGSDNAACPTLIKQVPVVEKWIDTAAAGSDRFIVIGDWNHRLAQPNNAVWAELDDGKPENADLLLADQGRPPHCDKRYTDFIDHIVMDKRAAADFLKFGERKYATRKHYSDHCPVWVKLGR